MHFCLKHLFSHSLKIHYSLKLAEEEGTIARSTAAAGWAAGMSGNSWWSVLLSEFSAFESSIHRDAALLLLAFPFALPLALLLPFGAGTNGVSSSSPFFMNLSRGPLGAAFAFALAVLLALGLAAGAGQAAGEFWSRPAAGELCSEAAAGELCSGAGVSIAAVHGKKLAVLAPSNAILSHDFTVSCRNSI